MKTCGGERSPQVFTLVLSLSYGFGAVGEKPSPL